MRPCDHQPLTLETNILPLIGPLWGSQSACCENYGHLGSLEPDSRAIDGSPGLYEQVWLKHMKPLVPKELVWSGTSNVRGGKTTDQAGPVSRPELDPGTNHANN